MDFEEEIILKKLADVYKNKMCFWNEINSLTGNFVMIFFCRDQVIVINDATGMQACFYGVFSNNIFLSSHSKLIGDVCGLQIDPYVKRLTSYKFYRLRGRYLPGDISPYEDFYRLIPNHKLIIKNNTIKIERFYNVLEHIDESQDYDDIVKKSANILNSSLKLILAKWDKPAVSLTGGTDSKTTLACANGLYDRYNFFSYISNEAEFYDAYAAKEISEKLGLNHKIYDIDANNDNFESFDTFKVILEENCGLIGPNNENDIRKRMYFLNHPDFDVEVKSWVSEVGRTYHQNRFNKKKLNVNPSIRYLTTMYKFFFHNRRLVKDTQQQFKNFIIKHNYYEILSSKHWADIYYWEYNLGKKLGLTLSNEHNISFEITIPHNNRMLLSMMLSSPLIKRFKSQLHFDIIDNQNKKINDLAIHINNVKHTRSRKLMERLYLFIHSKLPF